MEEQHGRVSDIGLRDPAVRVPDLERAAQVAHEGDVRDSELGDEADTVRRGDGHGGTARSLARASVYHRVGCVLVYRRRLAPRCVRRLQAPLKAEELLAEAVSTLNKPGSKPQGQGQSPATHTVGRSSSPTRGLVANLSLETAAMAKTESEMLQDLMHTTAADKRRRAKAQRMAEMARHGSVGTRSSIVSHSTAAASRRLSMARSLTTSQVLSPTAAGGVSPLARASVYSQRGLDGGSSPTARAPVAASQQSQGRTAAQARPQTAGPRKRRRKRSRSARRGRKARPATAGVARA